MIVLDSQGLNSYDADGLNGGLKIAKALKKVTLKGAIKAVKTVAPMALSLIPVVGGSVGGAVGKALTKVTTNANGTSNLIGRAISGTSGDGTQNLVGRITTQVKEIANTEVGKAAIKIASPLVKNAKATILEQSGMIPTDAQLETLAEQKGTTAQQELNTIVEAASNAKVITPTTPAKSNTMLYVGGGVIAAGILYAVLK